MKRKIVACLLAGMMVFSCNSFVFAESSETEIAEEYEEETGEKIDEDGESEEATDTFLMAGVDEKGIAWSIALSTEEGYACVALKVPGEEEATYVAGPVKFTEESFTITDEEDGQEYVFGYQDVSETETILTYEPTGTEVKLAVVDDAMTKNSENMSIYAGVEPDGTQLTMGFDWDNMELAIDERNAEGQNMLQGTFEVAEDQETVTFTAEDGAQLEFAVKDVEGVDNQIEVTLAEQTFVLGLVDMSLME